MNNFINNISDAIYGVFGDDVEIYINNVEQDLKEPCFFINLMNTSQSTKLMGRYNLVENYEICYIPKNEDINELDEVSKKLYKALEYISIDNKLIAGKNMKAEMEDNILYFFVTYNNRFYYEYKKNDTMENLKEKIYYGRTKSRN